MFDGASAIVARMIEVSRSDNGRTAWCWQRPLGVACLCGHCALVPLEKIGAGEGDMQYLYDRKFTCSKCGGRTVQLWFMTSEQDVAEFTPRQT